MGLISILPEMGPFPLEDTQGVSLAVSMLRRSLDKGRCRETVWKMRSAYFNIWHASKYTLAASVITRDLKKN